MNQVPLRRVIQAYIGGGWGKEAPDEDHTVPASVIRGTDLDAVQSGVTSGVPYRWHKASNARSRILGAGDIVFEVSGGSKDQPVGRSLLFDDARLAKIQGSVIPASFCKKITPNQGSIHPRFLLAHLQLAWVDRRIVQWQVQSTGISNFNFESFLDDFLIELPPLPVQLRIANILSAYDELIENSQRRIKILESMARALYREWFVHFRFPGHESVPLVPSTLGEIPEGWEVGRLDDVLVLQRGFDLPKVNRVEGHVPIYAATGVTGFHNEAKAKAPGVVTGRSGTIGDVIYVQDDFWPLNTALWAKEFPRAKPLYAFYFLSSIDLKQFNSGAAVPTLNRNDIHGLDALIPPYPVQQKFQDVAGEMLEQARKLSLQLHNLRRTRDLLLPRLLSGQIDVEAMPA